jgi:hypothetical protein
LSTVEPTTDGGFLAAGWRFIQERHQVAAWLVKVSAEGDSLWSRTYRDSSGVLDLIPSDDGRFLLIGSAYQDSVDENDVLLTIVDSTGEELSRYTYGQSGIEENPWRAVRTMDGGILICGESHLTSGSRSYAFLLKLNSQYEVEWWYTENEFPQQFGSAAHEIAPGEYLMGGAAIASADRPNLDFIIQRLRMEQPVDPLNFTLPGSFTLLQNYPNPFNSSTTVSFSLPQTREVKFNLYDVLGRNVGKQPFASTKIYSAGEHRVTFDGTGLSSGIYFVRMEAGGNVQTKKMILIR